MKKYWRVIGGVAFLIWLSGTKIYGQMADPQIATLQQTLSVAKDASEKVKVLNELSRRLNEVNPREARKYADDAFKLAGKTENKNGETLSLVRMAQADYYLGNYDLSKAYFLNAIDLYQNTNNKAGEIEALRGVCDVFSALARNYKLKNDEKNAEQYANFYQIYLKKYETASEGLVDRKLTASSEPKKEEIKKENTENNNKNELSTEEKKKILDEIKHTEIPKEIETMSLLQKETEIKHLRREKNKKDKQITYLIEENLSKDDVLEKQNQNMLAWIFGLSGILLAGGVYVFGYWKTKNKNNTQKENTTHLHEKLNRQEVILREKDDILKKKETELAQAFLQVDEAKLETNTLYQLLNDEMQPQVASMSAIADMENPSVPLLRQQAKRLNNLINSTVAVGQWERQKNAITLTRKSVKEIADKAINNYSELFAQKQLIIENRISENLLAQMQADVTLTIFTNLLDNALHYAPKNSKIIIDAETIADKDAEFIKISQTDTGKHIPINSQKSTFGKIPSMEGRPSAWGLVYVKLLVEAQGGNVNVQSSQQETVFGFTLKA
ncbi:MAG: sensor histidine kinase [Bacteroidetes bacterium]|nr:MAG: sensor histidine kinase [Bacteroidota bacterium]TAG88482.1 MAG: sensor histidine kinase [Bacteroidota bacterium]